MKWHQMMLILLKIKFIIGPNFSVMELYSENHI